MKIDDFDIEILSIMGNNFTLTKGGERKYHTISAYTLAKKFNNPTDAYRQKMLYRLQGLEKKGLVNNVHGTKYQITSETVFVDRDFIILKSGKENFVCWKSDSEIQEILGHIMEKYAEACALGKKIDINIKIV